MNTLKNSALIYRPCIRVWAARRLDKDQTEKVNDDAGAVTGAARVNKHLLPDFPELEAVQKYAAGFRNFVYRRTLPWDDGGARIGRATRHLDFMTEVGDAIRDFDVLVDAAIGKYDEARANAQFTLGAMYDASDYPGVAELRAKFSISLDVMPLPDVGDFRVVEGLSPDEVEPLIQAATQATEQKVGACKDLAYERLYTAVRKMADTLADFEAKRIRKFNDTLMGNLSELVCVMPALNITGDAMLTDLTAQAEALLVYAPKELRADEFVRAAAIAEARALADKFPNAQAGQAAPLPAVRGLFADMMEV